MPIDSFNCLESSGMPCKGPRFALTWKKLYTFEREHRVLSLLESHP